MSHVFLSYVREDLDMVRRLAQELARAGIVAWTDRDSIKPGSDWRAAIEDAIRNGAFFIPCFTSAYANRESTYMDEEVDLAAEQLRSQRQNRSWFIPVVFSRGKVPDRVIGPGYNLQDIQWVDLDADWREGVNTLVNVILERLLPDSRQSASDPQTRARTWKRIDRLASQLTDPTASVEDRRHAAEMLVGLAPAAAHAVAALQRALADEDESTRTFAVRTLVAMGDAAAEALVAAIGSPVADIRAAALSALHALGPRAAPYTDRLIEAMASASDDATTFRVSEVLVSIGEAAVQRLVAEMERRNPRTLHGAARALGPEAAITASPKSCYIRPALHPRAQRCSSVAYSRYAPSSRLARGAHRRPRC
jgi:TIR domain/HEAT repeats